MKTYLLICVPVLLLISSCSSVSQHVDESIQKEPPPQNRQAFQESTSKLIDEAQNLTSDQKSRLYTLQAKIRNELHENTEESLKIRSLLLKNLISDHYQEKTNRELKRRLRQTEGSRLTILLNGVDDANRILGNTADKNNRILRNMLDFNTQHY